MARRRPADTDRQAYRPGYQSAVIGFCQVFYDCGSTFPLLRSSLVRSAADSA
ncbi:unnamed protein product [Penicillium roqueforti FM164]|uniref:Genomic scaffold, ProqFM164S02 n=1 Tax=Penicillium roqueforti (strain FM164) TaxID=1365484 RepID=W6Q676_PENRF|nr:unnamed protein product [Penicillium roqueforti FM164]